MALNACSSGTGTGTHLKTQSFGGGGEVISSNDSRETHKSMRDVGNLNVFCCASKTNSANHLAVDAVTCNLENGLRLR